MNPKNLKQINNYIGSPICVHMKDDSKVEGVLSFFNWEQQIIHLSDYNTKNESGEFMVINQKEWAVVKVIKQ